MTEEMMILIARVEDLAEAVGRLEKCATVCPFMDEAAAAVHSAHHEVIERALKFLDEIAAEVRKSVIRAIPSLIWSVFILAAVGAAALYVFGKR